MDKLKQFIEDNSEAFDCEELPRGHSKRFEQKLALLPSAKKPYIFYALAVAASIGLLLLLSLPQQTPSDAPNIQKVCQSAEDIQSLRLYYSMQMNKVISRMQEEQVQDNISEKQLLLREASRIMANCKQFDENIIPTLPCSEHGIFAITQYYGTCLQNLNFMLTKIEENN